MISEDTYADYLNVYFNRLFGDDAVTREVYTNSGRFCDFYIESEFVSFAVEVENKSEDVVTNGVGQALLYADELDAVPVVVYPPSNGEKSTELDILSQYVTIIEIPFEL